MCLPRTSLTTDIIRGGSGDMCRQFFGIGVEQSRCCCKPEVYIANEKQKNCQKMSKCVREEERQMNCRWPSGVVYNLSGTWKNITLQFFCLAWNRPDKLRAAAMTRKNKREDRIPYANTKCLLTYSVGWMLKISVSEGDIHAFSIAYAVNNGGACQVVGTFQSGNRCPFLWRGFGTFMPSDVCHQNAQREYFLF